MVRRNKYHARKVEIDGQTFDSVKEARRYQALRLMERAGEISNLQRQVRFELIPTQREPDTVGPKGGIHKGKRIEYPICYVADFVYKKDGKTVVEDAKGVRTKEYIMKRKLMLFFHGIRILET